VNSVHFIRFRDIPLLYGRVPKVANSSIKAALCKLLLETQVQGIRTTSDNFWKTGTNGQTSMLSAHDARMCRGTHFSFSFVRNPFDRIVSAYNNKILELKEIPGRMQEMGLKHSMSFGSFLEIVASTSNDQQDIHLLPQSKILCLERQVIPNFIGHFETIERDWCYLQKQLRRERLPHLGELPQKNVRRKSDRRDIQNYFADPGFIRTVANRYGDDLEMFYGNKTIGELIEGN